MLRTSMAASFILGIFLALSTPVYSQQKPAEPESSKSSTETLRQHDKSLPEKPRVLSSAEIAAAIAMAQGTRVMILEQLNEGKDNDADTAELKKMADELSIYISYWQCLQKDINEDYLNKEIGTMKKIGIKNYNKRLCYSDEGQAKGCKLIKSECSHKK